MNAVNVVAENGAEDKGKPGGARSWDAGMTTGAQVLDLDKLRAAISDLLTRADGLLTQGAALANKEGFELLYALAWETAGLDYYLGGAIPARKVLQEVHRTLALRALAVVEVCDDVADVRHEMDRLGAPGISELLEGCALPERWRKLWPEPAPLNDEEIPF